MNEHTEIGKNPYPSAYEDIAQAIHYPKCWDTAAYPSLVHALWAMASTEGTSTYVHNCTNSHCDKRTKPIPLDGTGEMI